MSLQNPPTQPSVTYPQRQPVSISAGTAMKIGFFGAFGALLFSIIVSIIGFVIVCRPVSRRVYSFVTLA